MDEGQEPKDSGHKEPCNSDLLLSAKFLVGAAQGGMDKVDKSQAAEAAGDLLGAASRYGNLEEKGFGKYINQAQGYLHQYHSTTADADASHSTKTETATETATHSSKSATGDHGRSEESGGGAGDYIKMAQGFLNK